MTNREEEEIEDREDNNWSTIFGVWIGVIINVTMVPVASVT